MRALAVILACWSAGAARAGAGPATAPATTATAPAERKWGPSKAGASASVAQVGRWVLGGPLRLDFALRNVGAVPVSLGEAESLYGYLLIGQGQTVHYTEKIRHAAGLAGWTGRLAGGEERPLPPVDAAGLKAFAYGRGLKLVDGYPARMVDGRPAGGEPAGAVAAVLQPGPVKVKYLLYADRGAEGKLLLDAAVLQVQLELPVFASLSPADQRRVLDGLAERLRKDAWSAKVACPDAVRVGGAAVPTLTKIAADQRAAGFARMWAATALAEIGGDAAAAVLIECLTDPDPGVRHVAAYHGLRARSDRFDQALIKRALSLEDPGVTAWTIRGYLSFRGAAPADLVRIAVGSDSARVRATVAQTLAGASPDRSQLPIFRILAADSDEQVRVIAARALRLIADRSHETLEALVAALARDGDQARHAAAGTLSALTNQQWPYDPSATPEEKAAVVKKWRQWWEDNKDLYRRGGKANPRS